MFFQEFYKIKMNNGNKKLEGYKEMCYMIFIRRTN